MQKQRLYDYNSIDIIDSQKTKIATIYVDPPKLSVYDDEMFHFIPVLRKEWIESITIDNIVHFLSSRVSNISHEKQFDELIAKKGQVHSDPFVLRFKKKTPGKKRI